jgi:hypothetical protein
MRTRASAASGVIPGMTRYGSGVVIAVLLLLSSARGQGSGEDKKKPVILVPPFENQSRHHEMIPYDVATGKDPDRPKRRFTVDRYTEAPRSLLEDMLGQISGITIVERQRVDALLVESQFGQLSGLVDTESAIRLGKLLGAKLIVLGSIIDIRDEKREFRGYGIATKNTEVQCRIRVRLLDIGSGTVKFSKVLTGSKSFAESNFGGTSSSDRNFGAVEATLQKLEGDEQFRRAILGGKAEAAPAEGLVVVEFAPKPENCDIEIDGKYVGGSPLKRRLSTAKEYKVRIIKGGFQTWEGVIVPEEGMRITRELDRER